LSFQVVVCVHVRHTVLLLAASLTIKHKLLILLTCRLAHMLVCVSFGVSDYSVCIHGLLCVCFSECDGGQVWTDCGSCVETCSNYLDLVCTAECQVGCRCPERLPIWHEGQCTTTDECSGWYMHFVMARI